MQMVHFVWTYLRVVEQIEKETKKRIDHDKFRLDIVIPTGAMGNIAGCVSSFSLSTNIDRESVGRYAHAYGIARPAY